LFADYTAMGMDRKNSIGVIAQIFNREPKVIEGFLKKSGKL
jgi:hypothetical protein